MSEAFSPRPGDRIGGRYGLKTLVRGGGAAQTFLALDHHFGRDVELTVFDPARCTVDAWTAFTRVVEAAVAARVSGLELHPVRGSTLPSPLCCATEVQRARGLDRLREQGGALPWKQALALGERFVVVLDEVHAATRVAHRALAAARCVITAEDEVKVLDYGVAELEPAAGPTGDARYRAPEQSRGVGDHRSDMYSLAAILFELISGERPSIKLPSRLRSITSGIPQRVDDLFARALARTPEQRFGDLQAMRAAMRELLELPPIAARAVQAAPPAEPAASASAAIAVAPAVTPDKPEPLLMKFDTGPLAPRSTTPVPLVPAPKPRPIPPALDNATEALPVLTLLRRPSSAQEPVDVTEVLPVRAASPARPTAPEPVDATEVLPVHAASPAWPTAPEPDDTTEVLPALAVPDPQPTAPRTPLTKAQAEKLALQAALMDELPTMVNMQSRTSGAGVERELPLQGDADMDVTEVLRRIPSTPETPAPTPSAPPPVSVRAPLARTWSFQKKLLVANLVLAVLALLAVLGKYTLL